MEVLFSSMLATFIIGLSFGAGACMFTCIPTLGVMLLAQDIGAKETSLQTLRFNLGRMSAYALLAAVSGMLGASLVQQLDMSHANLIFAAMLLFSASLLWQKGKVAGCSSSIGHKKRFRAGLFGMGFGMGLRPCAPLAGVMAASALTGSGAYGLLLGLSFGAGAIVIPQLVFGYGLGRAGAEMRSQLRDKQQLLARTGASVLVVVGVGVGMGWLSL